MKIKILEQSETALKFVLEDADTTLANALRRIMMSEVPTMAIEFVDFNENSSALYDEIIAQRLGAIPLTFDEKIYKLPEDCECEGKGCAQCQVFLVLDKKGPCMVYSGDLKTTDESVKPTSDKFIIAELLDNQAIKLEAIAKLGKGEKHAKWQAAVVGYKYPQRDETKFTFSVESASGLKPEHIVLKAAEILEAKAEEFKKQLKDL